MSRPSWYPVRPTIPAKRDGGDGSTDNILSPVAPPPQNDTIGFTTKLIMRNIPPNFGKRELARFISRKKDPFVTTPFNQAEQGRDENDSTNIIPFEPLSVSSWTKQVIFLQITFKTKQEALEVFNSMKLLSYNRIPIALTLFRTVGGESDSMLPQRKAFCFFNHGVTNRIQFDDEAIYSISPQHAAIFGFLMIALFTPDRNRVLLSNEMGDGQESTPRLIKKLNIMDGCACIGGDSIAFAKMPSFPLLHSLLHTSLLQQQPTSPTASQLNQLPDVVDTTKPVTNSTHYAQLDFSLYPSLPVIDTTVTAVEYDHNRYLLLQANAKASGLGYHSYDLLETLNNLNTATTTPIALDLTDNNIAAVDSPQTTAVSSSLTAPPNTNPILNLIPLGPHGNLKKPNTTILRDSFTHIASPHTRSTLSNEATTSTAPSNPYSTQIYPNVLFLDPPWGGIHYMNQDFVRLGFGGDSLGPLLVDYIKQQYRGVNSGEEEQGIVVENNAKQKTELVVLKCPTNVDVNDVLLPLMNYRRELYQSYATHSSSRPENNNNNNTQNSKPTLPTSTNHLEPTDQDGCFIQRVVTPKITYFLIAIPDYDLSPPKTDTLTTTTPSLTRPTPPHNPFEMLQIVLSAEGVTDAQSFGRTQELLTQLLFTQCPPIDSTTPLNPGPTTLAPIPTSSTIERDNEMLTSQTWVERIVEAWGCSYDLFTGSHYYSPNISPLKVPQWYQNAYQDPNSESQSDLVKLIEFSNTLNEDAELIEYNITNTFNSITDTITLRTPSRPLNDADNANTNNNSTDQQQQHQQDTAITLPKLFFTLAPPTQTIPLTTNYRDNQYRDLKIEYQSITGQSLKAMVQPAEELPDPFARKPAQGKPQTGAKTYTPRNIRVVIENPTPDQKTGDRLKADVKAFALQMTQTLLNDSTNTGVDKRFSEFYQEDLKESRRSHANSKNHYNKGSGSGNGDRYNQSKGSDGGNGDRYRSRDDKRDQGDDFSPREDLHSERRDRDGRRGERYDRDDERRSEDRDRDRDYNNNNGRHNDSDRDYRRSTDYNNERRRSDSSRNHRGHDDENRERRSDQSRGLDGENRRDEYRSESRNRDRGNDDHRSDRRHDDHHSRSRRYDDDRDRNRDDSRRGESSRGNNEDRDRNYDDNRGTGHKD